MSESQIERLQRKIEAAKRRAIEEAKAKGGKLSAEAFAKSNYAGPGGIVKSDAKPKPSKEEADAYDGWPDFICLNDAPPIVYEWRYSDGRIQRVCFVPSP